MNKLQKRLEQGDDEEEWENGWVKEWIQFKADRKDGSVMTEALWY